MVKTIKFRTSDDKVVECDYQTAVLFSVVKECIENLEVLNEGIEIPIPVVSAKYLHLVIEYCNYHKDDSQIAHTKSEIDAFDKKFFDIDNETLAGIILAANYLHVAGLRDHGCKLFAAQLSGRKKSEEISKVFDIKGDSEKMEID